MQQNFPMASLTRICIKILSIMYPRSLLGCFCPILLHFQDMFRWLQFPMRIKACNCEGFLNLFQERFIHFLLIISQFGRCPPIHPSWLPLILTLKISASLSPIFIAKVCIQTVLFGTSQLILHTASLSSKLSLCFWLLRLLIPSYAVYICIQAIQDISLITSSIH